MTVTRAKELLPVFTAYADGKTIQWMVSGIPEWHDFKSSNFKDQGAAVFMSDTFLWRVKPEPREWRVCKTCTFDKASGNFESHYGHELVHVREVLE